jgi:hypothetical protein
MNDLIEQIRILKLKNEENNKVIHLLLKDNNNKDKKRVYNSNYYETNLNDQHKKEERKQRRLFLYQQMKNDPVKYRKYLDKKNSYIKRKKEEKEKEKENLILQNAQNLILLTEEINLISQNEELKEIDILPNDELKEIIVQQNEESKEELKEDIIILPTEGPKVDNYILQNVGTKEDIINLQNEKSKEDIKIIPYEDPIILKKKLLYYITKYKAIKLNEELEKNSERLKNI